MDALNTITEKECSKLVDQVLKEDNIIPSEEFTNQEEQKNGDHDMIQAIPEKIELAKETIDREKEIEKESVNDNNNDENNVTEDKKDVDMEEERRKQIEQDGLLSKALAEEEEEEEEEEAEYEVEKIVGHKIFKGKVVQYEIKWKGYPDEENTLEKANTIHNDVFDLCKQYWDNLGVKRPPNAPGYERESEKEEIKKGKSKKSNLNGESTVLGKRPRSASLDEDEEEKNVLDPKHVPRCMHEKGYRFPTSYPNESTQWNEEMKNISAVQLSPIDKSIMLTYVDWKNGEKTIHSMKEIHEKCPESLINYYEARLRFV